MIKLSPIQIIRTLSLLTLGLGLILVVTPAFAQTKSQSTQSVAKNSSRQKLPRPLVATWSTSLSGGVIQDDLSNQRTQAGLTLGLGLKYDLTSYLMLDLQPLIRFRNGYVQSATNTNGRETLIDLRSALARLQDSNYFEFKAGVIDLEENHSKLLVESSFPAVGLNLSTGKKSVFSADLLALAAVPSSTSQTNNSNDIEKTPQFSSVGVKLAVRSKELTGNFRASSFRYKDLPLATSTDSVLLGNTGFTSTNSSSTEFRYQFSGAEGHIGIEWEVTNSLKYLGGVSVVRNDLAPEKRNQAYLLENQAQIIFSDDFTLIPSFDFFRSESDATIANYNDPGISTNRIGYRTGIGFLFQNSFKLAISGGERAVIFETPALDRERFLTLTLETLDAQF